MPAKAGIHDFLAAAGELTKLADGIADQYIRGVIGPATACAPHAANPKVIDPLDAPIGWRN